MLVVLLAGRTRAVQEQARRARAAIGATAGGDWLLIDSLPTLNHGAVALVTAAEPVPPLPGDVPAPTGALTLYVAFAPECAVCRSRAPVWRELIARVTRDLPALRVVGIAALPDTGAPWRDSAVAFLDAHGLRGLPTAIADTRRRQRALALRSAPQTFLADAAGRVWWAARDSVQTAVLADSLPGLLRRIAGGGESGADGVAAPTVDAEPSRATNGEFQVSSRS